MYRKNVGTIDRLARFVAGSALLLTGLFLLGGLHGRPLGILALVIGIAGLGTALTGRCPGYVPFGIDTRPSRHAAGSNEADSAYGCPQEVVSVAEPIAAPAGATENSPCDCGLG